MQWNNLSKWKINYILTAINEFSEWKLWQNETNLLPFTAGRNYDQDLLMEHKANVMKSRQIIKSIINIRKFIPDCAKCMNNDSIIEDGKIVADKFIKRFCQCWRFSNKIDTIILEKTWRKYQLQNIGTVLFGWGS